MQHYSLYRFEILKEVVFDPFYSNCFQTSQLTFSSSSASTDGILDPSYGDSESYSSLLTRIVGAGHSLYA
jgi:hypothetical protein